MQETFAGDLWESFAGYFCGRLLREMFRVVFAVDFCGRVLQGVGRRVLLDLSQLTATSSHNYDSKIELKIFIVPIFSTFNL